MGDNNMPEKKGEETKEVKKDDENLAKKSTWTLRRELKRQTLILGKLDSTSNEYKTVLEMIQRIQVILSIRANNRTNVLKALGALGITAVGLALTYGIGDKSPDSMPNRETKRFSDNLAGKLFKF